MEYVKALPDLKTESAKVNELKREIRPFETTKMSLPHRKRKIYGVFWWEFGYNALRHRTIIEFDKSATLKHALFSLAGLWVLHDRLDRDWGRKHMARSHVFEPRIGF